MAQWWFMGTSVNDRCSMNGSYSTRRLHTTPLDSFTEHPRQFDAEFVLVCELHTLVKGNQTLTRLLCAKSVSKTKVEKFCSKTMSQIFYSTLK